MPGLVGIIDPAGSLGRNDISRGVELMCSAILHDRAYKVQNHTGERWGIGGVFLPSESNAPFPHQSRAGEGLFIDGELYRLNDEDVLGDMYYGRLAAGLSDNPENILNKIDGSFVFLFQNTNAGEYIIANDVTGARPMYYIWDAGVLYFAPEVKALLAVKPEGRRFSEQSIANYLASGIPYFDETYFPHIKCLRPASLLKISLLTGKMTLGNYWQFKFNEDAKDAGAQEYSRELIRLIDRAVARRMRDRDKNRIGLSLSAGYDSRSILGSCLRQGITVGTTTHGVSQEVPQSDAYIVKDMCSKLGIKNLFYHLNPNNLSDNLERIVYFSDGDNDQVGNFPDGLSQYQEISRDYDVILRGDELYGYLGAPFNEEDALGLAGYIKLPSRFGQVLKQEPYNKMLRLSECGLTSLSAYCPNRDLVNRKDFFVFNEQVPNVLNKLNHIKQMHVRIRNPHLDREVLDFMSNLPPRHRLFRSLFVSAITAANPEVFAFPAARRNSLPNWKQMYAGSEKMRKFVRAVLFESRNSFFDELVDFTKLKGFLEEYHKDACRKQQEVSPGFRPHTLKGKVAYEIRANYYFYKLLLPLLKHKKNSSAWLDSSYILIRLLVIKLWSDLFLTENRCRKASAGSSFK